MSLRVTKVMESCLYVTDLDAAKAFYENALGFEVLTEEPGRHVFFRCGDSMFLIFNPEAAAVESVPGIGVHGAHGQGHIAFEMDESKLESWRHQLLDAGVEIESDFHWPNGGRSLYFRDPSGNSVELVTAKTWGL